jgi:hypothetical protein
VNTLQPSQMSSRVDREEKHVLTNKTLSQQEGVKEEEEYSRPSTSNHEAIQHHGSEVSTPKAHDKEAQTDAHSTLTTESAILPPPDGGLHAWLKVFGGFMIYINIWYAKHPTHLPSTPNILQLTLPHTGASP